MGSALSACWAWQKLSIIMCIVSFKLSILMHIVFSSQSSIRHRNKARCKVLAYLLCQSLHCQLNKSKITAPLHPCLQLCKGFLDRVVFWRVRWKGLQAVIKPITECPNFSSLVIKRNCPRLNLNSKVDLSDRFCFVLF